MVNLVCLDAMESNAWATFIVAPEINKCDLASSSSCIHHDLSVSENTISSILTYKSETFHEFYSGTYNTGQLISYAKKSVLDWFRADLESNHSKCNSINFSWLCWTMLPQILERDTLQQFWPLLGLRGWTRWQKRQINGWGTCFSKVSNPLSTILGFWSEI